MITDVNNGLQSASATAAAAAATPFFHVTSKTCNETVHATQDQGYYDGLMGSRIRAFDWHQNQ